MLSLAIPDAATRHVCMAYHAVEEIGLANDCAAFSLVKTYPLSPH